MNPKNLKINLLLDLILGVSLAYILALVAKCPVADSINAGLVLMIVLMLIDMRGSQVQ